MSMNYDSTEDKYVKNLKSAYSKQYIKEKYVSNDYSYNDKYDYNDECENEYKEDSSKTSEALYGAKGYNIKRIIEHHLETIAYLARLDKQYSYDPQVLDDIRNCLWGMVDELAHHIHYGVEDELRDKLDKALAELARAQLNPTERIKKAQAAEKAADAIIEKAKAQRKSPSKNLWWPRIASRTPRPKSSGSLKKLNTQWTPNLEWPLSMPSES